MRAIPLGIIAFSLLAGCSDYGGQGRMRMGSGGYDYNRPDPGYGGYEADRYYRNDPGRYQERRLSRDERIYRGQDGRYYCRHSDGTTGLIVGALAGGVLGNAIAPGGSEVFGTVLGAIAGGAAGQAIDSRTEARCR
ncbi:glycine zipper 2TM domain-containing protein [Novosphingobium sp. 1748]|uniref:glycine zipper 2TM domain-containing protein n=1 Tax=Novosphingobium sp. 1748 TaxID=2817760 RepID=UPI00286A6840|nr:glycine zipper 2TM domain-containing protein [Novosphingobium sp. 1748]